MIIVKRYSKQAGLGIIDILMGLFVGLIVVLTTYASLTIFQTYERVGVNSNSALENGIIGLFAIAHDLEMAGLGLIANGTSSCNSLNASYNGSTLANNIPVYAAAITDGGTNPDSINIMYSNSILSAAPAYLLTPTNISSGSMTINSSQAIQKGSLALLSTKGNLPCTLVKVTDFQDNAINSQVSFDAGSSPNITYPANTVVASINRFIWVTWSVNDNVLQYRDNTNGDIVPVADNIVQMQAQYGISNTNSTAIQQWVDATGNWANLNNTEIAQIRAIRVAIVARNPQPTKPATNGACNATTQFPLPWPGGTPIDLSSNPKWQCYRYKVFKTVIPLQNIVLGGIQ